MKNNRPHTLDEYSTPGEFKRAAEAGGLHVPIAFCAATSGVMRKYSLTFVEACRFLEEQGVLIWAGAMPLYNLKGDVLWREERIYEPAPEPESEYTTETELKCAFFSLVIKNEALERKYPGGLAAFVKKHLCEYNKDIAVMYAMGTYDLDDAIEDIETNGLVDRVDFYVFDAGIWMFPPLTDVDRVELKVDWLEGRSIGGKVFVSSSQGLIS